MTSDHPSAVTGLAFNPKGKRLAVAHYGGVSLWWASSLGRNVRRLDCKGSHIAVTWSPDGSTVMSSMQGNELHGWQLESGADMTMRGYSTKVRAMDWSTKPMTLLTSGADSVIAWKFSGGGPMGKPPTDIGRGIGRLVTAVAVRPRHPFVAAGFDDGQVAVCSTKDGPIIRMRPGDSDRIAALAWSADGQWLACGSESGHVSVFDLPGEAK